MPLAALLLVGACKPSRGDLVQSGVQPVTPREAVATAADNIAAAATLPPAERSR